jgi:outer membrane protein assembly factor BamB
MDKIRKAFSTVKLKTLLMAFLVCTVLMTGISIVKPGGIVSVKAASVDWWPMFRHDLNHTAYSTSPAPNTTGYIWYYTTGYWVDSSPAVVSGQVYVGSCDGNVYCLNASTGEQKWNYTTGGRVESSPAVANGQVYVGSDDNNLYCLNANTGAYIWNYTTGGAVDSSPAVANGKVYVGSEDGKVYCLNANTGAYIWNYTTGAGVFSGVYSSPAVVSGQVYVGSYDENVYCLNANTGAKIWSYTTGDVVRSSPAVSSGRVYVGSCDGNVYCLNANTGASIWNYTTGSLVCSSPAVIDGQVYIGSYDSNLYCLNASTGAYIWSYELDGQVGSSPAVAYDQVYVETWGGGGIYALGPVNDVAVTNVVPSKSLVGQNYSMPINVTVENQGSYKETFNVTTYANATIIQKQTVTLASGNSTTLTFTWNTRGFAYGNYTISAYATPVAGETNLADNTYVGGKVVVTIPGDFNGDGKVNPTDFVIFLAAYGFSRGQPAYNANCDINGDGKVNSTDFVIFLANYGKSI